jgi:hypothetical protein
MSNCILNVRFGGWFVQLLRDRPYLRVSEHPGHGRFGGYRMGADWRWFELYEAPWK